MSRALKLVPKPFQVPLCDQNSAPQFSKREASFPWINTSGGTWQGHPSWQPGDAVSHSWSHIISLAILTSWGEVTLLWSLPRCYLTFLKFIFLFYCCTHYLSLSPHCFLLSPFPLIAFLPPRYLLRVYFCISCY
jgi:hypothetical protein